MPYPAESRNPVRLILWQRVLASNGSQRAFVQSTCYRRIRSRWEVLTTLSVYQSKQYFFKFSFIIFFPGKVGTDCSSHSCTFTVLPHEVSNAHFRFSSRFTFFLYVPILDYGRLPSFVVIRKVRAMLTLTWSNVVWKKIRSALSASSHTRDYQLYMLFNAAVLCNFRLLGCRTFCSLLHVTRLVVTLLHWINGELKLATFLSQGRQPGMSYLTCLHAHFHI